MKKTNTFTKTFCKTSLVFLLLFASSALFAQNVGINTTGATPSSNAILDLNSGNNYNLGLILPHVELGASLTTFSPPMANAPTTQDTGMMVYNVSSLYQPIGVYYWNGATWINAGGTTSGWNITGNTGTTPGVNYAGTSDANAFVIKTNATERMRFLALGNAGIGTTTPQSTVDVNGNMSIGTYAGVNAAPANGVIISGQVGIGTNTPNASAALDVTSTTAGFLPPRMTQTQMNAIVSPAIGLMVLNTNTNCIEYWSGLSWQSVVCPCSAPPATPGVITGNATACASSAGNVYSIIAVPNTTSYSWSVPVGATITAGAGTTTITVTFGTTSGNITVAAVNSCGTSGTSTLAITLSTIPAAPAVPSGNISPTISNAYTYTIAPVAGATGYKWSVSSTNGAVTAGQGTTAATITYGATPATMNICVYDSNTCGKSTSSCLSVTSTTCAHSSITFNYIGAVQTWPVPACISQVTVTMTGASGGWGGNATLWNPGGLGGTVVGVLTVTGGTTLDLYVGGIGGNETLTAGGTAGYNGGGTGGDDGGTWLGGGGGGASDIRVTPYALANRVVVTGGGGGGGDNTNTLDKENGGVGGGATGGSGWFGGIINGSTAYCGQGGTQIAGGAAATSCVGSASGLGIGGNSCAATSGGGGGGGYYGGGCGCYGGAGGGSSYVGGLFSVTTNNQGTNTGNGSITIQY